MIYLISYIISISILYSIIGWNKIIQRIKMYGYKQYWTDYNIIELSAWMAKAIIIIPGLVFGVEIWQLHFLTLTTSALLIWASMKKSLPTLILFNTLWICISLTIILKNIW